MLLMRAAWGADAGSLLVLYSNNRLTPGNVAVDQGLRAVATQGANGEPVELYSEFLDSPAFAGDAYEQSETRYLQEKYATRVPDVIIVVANEALAFMLRHREELFPGIPIVHAAVWQSSPRANPNLPRDVVGVPVEYAHTGTIRLALRWHPKARRLIVITGASELDRQAEAQLRREVPGVAGTLETEFLAALPTASVLQRVARLDRDSVVYTPGYFADGVGRLFSPRESAGAIAAASTAPVYGPLEPFIGMGVVGGLMPSFEDMGREAARAALQIMAGADPANLELPEVMPTPVRVDWRQVRRWGIDTAKIPADAIVEFREPTFWEAYRNVAMLAIAVILLQTALIIGLQIERRRRRRAELAVQEQRTELAHAMRLAVAGELTASIAHEINQPLGAILASAETASLLLDSSADRREDLKRIVTRIQRDDLRASDVIRRLRALFAKHEPERIPFAVDATVDDVATLLHAEGERRGVTLRIERAAAPSIVLGDQTQVQQVLINLVLNAMDSVAQVPEDRRTVTLSVERGRDAVAIIVRDRGLGIAREDLPRLFDSFYSTKQRGMGLGLSIARTIVEAHGGRIWAANDRSEGAAFHVELPIHG